MAHICIGCRYAPSTLPSAKCWARVYIDSKQSRERQRPRLANDASVNRRRPGKCRRPGLSSEGWRFPIFFAVKSARPLKIKGETAIFLFSQVEKRILDLRFVGGFFRAHAKIWVNHDESRCSKAMKSVCPSLSSHGRLRSCHGLPRFRISLVPSAME